MNARQAKSIALSHKNNRTDPYYIFLIQRVQEAAMCGRFKVDIPPSYYEPGAIAILESQGYKIIPAFFHHWAQISWQPDVLYLKDMEVVKEYKQKNSKRALI